MPMGFRKDGTKLGFQKGNHPKTEFKKGQVAWNKGKPAPWAKNLPQKFKKGLIPWSKSKKGVCLNTGKTHFNKGQIAWNKGKHIKNNDALKKWRGNGGIVWNKGRTGNQSHSWKGGITPFNIKIRFSIEYRLWREAVFARDNWACQKCKIKSGQGKRIYLQVHHIQNFSQYPELRFAIDNGITFCKKCHRKFHRKYGIKNNIKQQLEKFIKNN